MPDLKISEFEERTAPQGSEDLGAAEGGLNIRIKLSTLRVFLNAAWGDYAGFIKASERSKLAGIAANATANSSDAFLLNRANHTGSQSVATITGLGKVATTNLYSDLDGRPTLPGLATSSTPGLIALSPGMTLDPLTNQLYVTRYTEQPALDAVMKSPEITLSNFNYTATGSGNAQAAVIGTTGNFAGKWYFEVVFASGTPSPDNAVGVAPINTDLDGIAGVVGAGAVIRQSTGAIAVDNSTTTAQGASYGTVNNVVRVAIDATAGRVWFAVGSSPWNANSSANPATGVGGLAIARRKLYPFISLATGASFTVRFGGTMSFTAPAGFAPWSVSSQGMRLADMADVDSSGWSADLVLKYDTASGKWKALPEANYVTEAHNLVNQATQAAEDAIAAKDAVDATVDTVSGYAADALASKNAAAASATAAADSATASATSATAAADSATASATSATNASTSATAAGNSATAANTSKNAAASSATAAAGSATAASTSAGDAAQSATDALNSATAAANSRNDAQSAAFTAGDAAFQAQQFRSEAQTFASQAQQSDSNALNSMIAASGYANQAQTSATNAGTNASAAAASATAADGSASAAADSATAAAGSASAAADSATAAANSAAEAADSASGWVAGVAQYGFPKAKNLTGTVDWQTLDTSGIYLLPSLGTNGPPVSYTGTVIARVEAADNGVRTVTAFLNAIDSTLPVQTWTATRTADGTWRRWEATSGYGYRSVATSSSSRTISVDERGTLISVTPTNAPVLTLPALADTQVSDTFSFYNNFTGNVVTVKANENDIIGLMPDGSYPSVDFGYQVKLYPGESISFTVAPTRLRWIPTNYMKAPPFSRLPSGAVNLNTLLTPGTYAFTSAAPNNAGSVGWPPGVFSLAGYVEVILSSSDEFVQRIVQPYMASGFHPLVFERQGTSGGSLFSNWLYAGPISQYSHAATADCGPVWCDEAATLLKWNAIDSKYYGVPTYANRVVITSSGNWTPPKWAKTGRATIVPGGGAGGYTTAPPTNNMGAGAGGGGAGVPRVNQAITFTPNVAMAVTVGAGGVGTTSSAGDGGSSSFGGFTVLGGFAGAPNNGTQGGLGGEGAGSGGTGGPTSAIPGPGLGGAGAPGFFGRGGAGGGPSSGGGNATALSYGAGGGGAGGLPAGGTAKAGGNGIAGVVIIEY